MLCLAALHGMVALVGSEGDVMQVKTKKKGRNLNASIATARGVYPKSQYAKDGRVYVPGNGCAGLFSAFVYRKLLLVENFCIEICSLFYLVCRN